MAIPYAFAGIFILGVLSYGIYNNHNEMKFNGGIIATAIIFSIVIFGMLEEA